MLTKQTLQLITYRNVTVYEQTYQLPVLKNTKLKSLQKRIRERRRLIKSGVRYHHQFGGIIKRKEEISQGEIFDQIQLLIRDYTYFIDLLENYKDSYQHFLFKLTDDLKQLFAKKYLEIKSLDEDRKNLETKTNKNQNIVDELSSEKQENVKAILLLSNAYFLTLEKIYLLDEGIKKLAEDTKNQKQIVQKIVKELEVYQEVYEYQKKAQKVRQEIAKLAQNATNIENILQDYFIPFQSLIDEVVKVDEDFYATVGDIKNLANNTLNQSNLLLYEQNDANSENFLDLMVTSYEKKERLKDAFIQSQLLNWQIHNLDTDSGATLSSVEETEFIGLTNDDVTFTKELKSNKNIDYTELWALLAQHKWKEADSETTKLMLKIMGKNYWNEVYKQDIDNFCCKALHTIDKLWGEYSRGYFGFSVQQSVWIEVGGQVDYETEKRLGDRLGWRKEGNWLDYEQLTFELSPTTPMGHLPAQWLHYDEHTFDLSPSSVSHLSMGAWRVGSWLVWQMHLFFSRAKICNL